MVHIGGRVRVRHGDQDDLLKIIQQLRQKEKRVNERTVLNFNVKLTHITSLLVCISYWFFQVSSLFTFIRFHQLCIIFTATFIHKFPFVSSFHFLTILYTFYLMLLMCLLLRHFAHSHLIVVHFYLHFVNLKYRDVMLLIWI